MQTLLYAVVQTMDYAFPVTKLGRAKYYAAAL